jgi:SAM-dependent methyltransferase
MERLTRKEDWNADYATGRGDRPSDLASSQPPLTRRVTSSYNDHLLWRLVYDRYLSPLAGKSIIEIGSAPGTHLVQLHEAYALVPYGVEYSERGAALNRQWFERHGIPAANVIEDDFFSADFQARYSETFDVVISRGFIEHFTDVHDVIAKHVALLATGGLLIVSIPRLTGLNHLLIRFFHREVIAKHNLEIMNKAAFTRLFGQPALEPLLCDYFGAFTFNIFNTRERRGPRYLALRACRLAQRGLDAAYRVAFGDRGVASHAFSPNLLFVGAKRPSQPCDAEATPLEIRVPPGAEASTPR